MNEHFLTQWGTPIKRLVCPTLLSQARNILSENIDKRKAHDQDRHLSQQRKKTNNKTENITIRE